jgi:hypothetical protein
MFFRFASETFGITRQDYERPYPDPIDVVAGAIVTPVLDGSVSTDIIGWTWCVAEDGRTGWVPDSWCEKVDAGWRLMRDFNALELTVRSGQRLQLLYSESGFVMARTEAGEQGWVPDGILNLENAPSGDANR